MKINTITIKRKFNLGKNLFENQDIDVEFDVSNDEGTAQELIEKCTKEFHEIVEASDLPVYVKDFWRKRQGNVEEGITDEN